MDAEPVASELTALDPNYLKVMRIRTGLQVVLLVGAGIVLELATDLVHGLFLLPLSLVALAIVMAIPLRRYRRKGFDMGDDRLRIVSGFLFYSDTIVPFGRVQHLDVLQGPLERAFNLATLVLHTAGTHNSSVSLPGLAHKDAVAMRETIRSHIKRGTL
ncbi:PH domain-containing protein [Qipengyuania oceanensis]|nr:PH domain-containing protein [Qipengyuania oceanensis]